LENPIKINHLIWRYQCGNCGSFDFRRWRVCIPIHDSFGSFFGKIQHVIADVKYRVWWMIVIFCYFPHQKEHVLIQMIVF